MKQFLIYCKIIFHFLNVLLIVFYLFPGSILGWFLYNDLNKQPRITADFTSNFINVSSNHFFIFFIFSLFGILSYLKDKKLNLIMIYLLFISTSQNLYKTTFYSYLLTSPTNSFLKNNNSNIL